MQNFECLRGLGAALNISLVKFVASCWLLVSISMVVPAMKADDRAPEVEISPAELEDGKILVHQVRSEFQAGRTKIRLLLPDALDTAKKYRVLYVLPVEAADEQRWGNSLEEVRKLNLPNKHDLICVFPTFSHLPWYADHPTNPEIRQESYLLKVVMPFVEQNYPAMAERDGRLLVGFSKSGWGAWSLLLRNPDLFAKAAAWDAPLMMEQPSNYGMRPIFETQENFTKYQLPTLVKTQAKNLGDSVRLISIGYGNFRAHHQKMHELTESIKLPCIYQDGPQRKHAWDGGWLEGAVDLLVNATEQPRGTGKAEGD